MLDPEELPDPGKPVVGSQNVVVHLKRAIADYNRRFDHELLVHLPPGEEVPLDRIEQLGEVVEKSESEILIRLNADIFGSPFAHRDP